MEASTEPQRESEAQGLSRAALRLYAFSFLSRFDQRRIAFDRLAEVSADDHPFQADNTTA